MADNSGKANCLATCGTPTKASENTPHSFVIFGASGDLSRKKLYPVLWILYRNNLLPPRIRFYGFARSKINKNDIRERAKSYIITQSGEEMKFESFWSLNDYLCGQYTNDSDFQNLNEEISKFEHHKVSNRIFYFAVPPCIFEVIATNIKNHCMSSTGWTRIILEKPFGRDLESSEQLASHMASLFKEQQLYRVDHYLGKEMVQNILTFRFANEAFTPAWNKDHIACVRISFKEDFGTQERGGYFDEIGMIRDVMQNHLTQILTLIAMEKPASLAADDIRDEKVKVLKAINPIDIKDVVLGQYIANPNKKETEGYLDDPTVPKDSLTATYAMVVLQINNERWKDVPFIMSCGKSLDEKKVEVRVQFLDRPEGDIFGGQAKRNELVLRVQPGEAIYLKLNLKTPGMSVSTQESELDLNYASRYGDIKLPDAYERLLLDIFHGSQLNFVRSDELNEAWRIFTPVLHHIETKKVKPTPYVFGSRGPPEAGEMLKKNNFVYTGTSQWHRK